MLHTLRGKISNVTPLTLDRTLTLEGASADAKAVGDAISEAKTEAKEQTEAHTKQKTNPHEVTAAQVGLGNCDNTADIDKPVSTAQADAIAEAKKAGTDAQTAAENAQTTADNAQKVAENALPKSGGAMTGDINMNGNHISGLPAPTEDSDIITKSYMETYITDTFLGGAW